jgi:hypothetical protein
MVPYCYRICHEIWPLATLRRDSTVCDNAFGIVIVAVAALAFVSVVSFYLGQLRVRRGLVALVF